MLKRYSVSVRGPNSTLNLTIPPRPRGEAASVVITEYDITSNSDLKNYVTSDGSDWMEGTPSAYEARGPHDAEIAPDGGVWIADSQANPERTVARLDPATGAVKLVSFVSGVDVGKVMKEWLTKNPKISTLIKLDREAKYQTLVDMIDNLNLTQAQLRQTEKRFSLVAMDDKDHELINSL